MSITPDTRVDLNNCTLNDLCQLPSIGQNLAYNIIKYRESNGDFPTIQQITKVKGIKNKTFEEVSDYICVSPSKKSISHHTNVTDIKFDLGNEDNLHEVKGNETNINPNSPGGFLTTESNSEEIQKLFRDYKVEFNKEIEAKIKAELNINPQFANQDIFFDKMHSLMQTLDEGVKIVPEAIYTGLSLLQEQNKEDMKKSQLQFDAGEIDRQNVKHQIQSLEKYLNPNMIHDELVKRIGANKKASRLFAAIQRELSIVFDEIIKDNHDMNQPHQYSNGVDMILTAASSHIPIPGAEAAVTVLSKTIVWFLNESKSQELKNNLNENGRRNNCRICNN